VGSGAEVQVGFCTLIGFVSLFGHQYNLATDQCQSGIGLFPDWWIPHYFLTEAYEQKGVHREAIKNIQKLRRSRASRGTAGNVLPGLNRRSSGPA